MYKVTGCLTDAHTVRIPDSHCIHIIPETKFISTWCLLSRCNQVPCRPGYYPFGHLYSSSITPAILTLGCHIGFASHGRVWSYSAAFLTVICHTDPNESGSLPFQNLLSNLPIIPSRIILSPCIGTRSETRGHRRSKATNFQILEIKLNIPS